MFPLFTLSPPVIEAPPPLTVRSLPNVVVANVADPFTSRIPLIARVFPVSKLSDVSERKN